jgi:NADH:ubiquinone oxidoreductase subunit 5 (subunit L)/multisubunit Na+/H+ antiporter MnhA subunit
MDTLRILLIGTLVGAPPLAYGLSFLEEKLTRRVFLIAAQLAAGVVLLSAIGLFVTLAQQPDSVIGIQLGTWLSLPGFEIALGARSDSFVFVQTALVSVVLLLVLSAWPQDVSLRWLMLAWIGVTLASVAGNLGQMFVGWTLSAWASSELARKRDRALRPVWLVQRVSDMALLVGFGMVWLHFESSLEFTAWTPEAIDVLRPELIESIALCVLMGVIGRCAQLPLTVWLETEQGFAAQTGNSMSKLSDVMVGVWNVPDGHEVAERLKADRSNRWHESSEDSVASPVLAWWLCAAFLPMGIGLLVRLEPLFAVAPHTRLLMVAVGAFTMLMCSANTAAQTNWPRVLSQFAVGQCGFVLIVMGLGNHSEGMLGVSAFLWQSVLIGVLLVANSAIRRRATGLMVVTMSLIVAGLCGRHAVADLVWEHARQLFEVPISVSDESNAVLLGTTETRLWWLVMATIFLAEFLTGFALIRAWLLSRRESSARPLAGTGRQVCVLMWITAVLVLAGGLLSRGEFHRSETGISWTPPSLIESVPLLPLSLAGAVLAWWMYSKPSSLPEMMAAAMGPFARLSRNRFYWDDLYFLLVVHPAAVIGEWLIWFDDRVLGRGAGSVRNGAADVIGESAEPLSRGSAMIGALTTVGSVAVLAWMLLWLRS